MTTAALMSKKPDEAGEQETCEYVSTRIDKQLLPLARAAAALSGDVSTQEFISDAVNEVAARVLGRKPIKRLPPPDKPKSTGRPKTK